MIKLPFSKFQQTLIHEKRLPMLHVLATTQPSDQSISEASMELYDTRTAKMPHELGCLWLEVYKDETYAERLGWAQFSGANDACRCEIIHVEEPLRLTGIATVLYGLAENLFGVGVVPTENLSPDAEQFWKKRQR
jgi:hypothetical protein